MRFTLIDFISFYFKRLFLAGKYPMNTQNSTSRREVIRRCIAAFVVIVALFAGLMARLAYLQLMDYEENRNQVLEQYSSTMVIPASRGAIYDRNGQVLAISETVYTVFISPWAIAKEDAKSDVPNFYRNIIADGLSDILNIEKSVIYEACKKTNSQYVVIQKNLGEEITAKIREFIINNKLYTFMNLEEDSKRYYERGTLACHVVGFNGTDGGLTGLEKYYNAELSGTDGLVVSAKNGAGYDFDNKYETYIEAQNGSNLVTTIDVNVQSIVEKYLEKVYYDQKVKNRVAAVVMDVDTGEIYASAVYPDFDLNSPFTLTGEFLAEYEAAVALGVVTDSSAGDESSPAGSRSYTDEELVALKSRYLNEMWNNKVVTELYEPGSTFKIVTTAMALEEGIANLNSSYDCRGYVDVDGQTIHCHKAGGHGEQTFAQTLQNSCNPAFISLGLRIGASTFMEYFEEFGFLELSGCDMLGENKTYYYGSNNSNFARVDLATYSFGQAFKTSIIQQLRAVSTVANGGYLVTPHIAKHLTDDDGNITYVYEYETDRQVVSADVAKTIVDIMYGGINSGSTKNAAVEGYSIAAKTGTSQKLDIKDENLYVSSCVAFAPAEDPEVAIIVVVDEPTAGDFYGGLVAAPVVSSILSEVLPYLEIPRTGEVEHVNVNVINYTQDNVDEAKKAIEASGLKCRVIGDGEIVVDQMPKAGTQLTEGGTVILYTDYKAERETVSVPDLMGYRAVDALQILKNKGLNVHITGAYSSQISGIPLVVLQDIPAGTEVEKGTVVTIEFRYYENVNG